MNIRNAKSVVVTFVLVMVIAVSLVTSLPANHPVSPPVADSTNPQPQPTGTSSYIPRSEPARIEPPSQPVPQQVVIQFAPDTTDAERIEYVESIGGTVVESIESIDTVILDVPEGVASQPLPQSAKVMESEQDYYVTALDDLAPVNDPRYAEQWALPAIGAPSAWTELPADAPKVTVAVIDSGICASHPDLAGRILDGWDFLEGDAVPQDDFGHGCSVSGVIAANMNDGIGIAGVAPNAQIMPLRVLNASGVGSYSDVAAAIVYAADNGAQVINLSLGGSNPSATLENAVNYAISKGVIVVAAAGNSGVEGALYPAAYPDVIAVGSVDPNLQHSNFSNYGSQIDIWAPGRDILTTKRDGNYSLTSGTSFAAPYVAGAEAIYIAKSLTQTFTGNVLSLVTQINATVTPTDTLFEIFTPTATPADITSNTPTPIVVDFIDYSDPKYGFKLRIPSNWHIFPASSDGIGTVTTITSFDRNLLDPNKSVAESILGVRIDLGLITYDRPQDVSLADWVAPDLANTDSFISQSNIVVNGINAVKQVYSTELGKSEYIVFIPSGQKVYFFAVIPFGDINPDAGEFETAETVLQSFSHGISNLGIQPTKPILYQSDTEVAPPDVIANAPSGYRLPFADQKRITNGPGCSSTHLGRSSEAIDFGLSTGTRVLATQTGNIVYAVYGYNDGFGNLLKLQHSDGNTSWYAHLDSFVKTTGTFSVGEFSALSDNTGNSTGAHLHFEVRNSSNQSIWIRDLPGITWYSGNASNPCQPAGNDDGTANGPAEGNGGSGTTEQCSNYSFNGVTLFNDIECRGTAVQINSTGFRNLDSNSFNDQTRSINVSSGWSARIWEHNDRGGATYCVPADKWDLSKDSYENGVKIVGSSPTISSIEVFQNSNCTAAALVDNASFIGQSANPTTVDPGQNFSIYFEVRNNGTSTWQTGSYWLQNLENSLGAGSQQGLGSNVSPNGTKRWDINMTAPTTPGTYRTGWRVNHNGSDFGPYMYIDVTVRQPSTCSQLASEVRLYDQINCPSSAGKVTNAGTGLWDVSGSFNDKAQSIEVPLGYSARLYKDNSESSPSVCVDNSDVNLRDNTFSDGSAVASSSSAQTTWVRIYDQDGCPASAPTTPSNFRQSGKTQTSMTLAWNDVSNETGYSIYEWNGSGFVYLASVSANQATYTDTRYGCGRDQYYEVSAYNNAGESQHTGWIQAYTQACPTVTNDDFNNATFISNVPYGATQTTVYATEAGDDPVLVCPNFSDKKFNTVWYRYIPNATGTLTVNTTGSGYDTVLGIWTGSRGSLVQKGCDDDGGGSTQSQLQIFVTSGITYYIEVAGYDSSAEGSLSMSVNLDAKPNPPTLVSPSFFDAINNRTITFSWNASSSTNVTGYNFRISKNSDPNVEPWLTSIATTALTYQYTLPGDDYYYWHVQAKSTNQNSDWETGLFFVDTTVPSVSISSPASESFLNTNQITINASASDAMSGISSLQFFVGYDPVAGAGVLSDDDTLRSYAPPPGDPANPNVQGSSVTSQAWNWYETGWDTDGSNGWSITWDASTVPDQGDVAFFVYAYDYAGNYQGTASWAVVLDRAAPWPSQVIPLPTYSPPTFLVSWEGTDVLSGIQSFDIEVRQDYVGDFLPWQTGVTTTSAYYTGTAGHTYLFRVITHDRAGNTAWSEAGALTTVVAPPPNDGFSAATLISAVPSTLSVDTRGASTAPTDPTPTCGYGKNSNSVWYKYTAPATGLLGIDTWGSDYDTVLAVWTGTISNLTLIQCNDDFYQGYTEAWLENVPVTAGATYYIEVMDYANPNGGTLNLYIDFASTPSNNDINTPITISAVPYNTAMDIRGATQVLDDPSLTTCNRLPGTNSVWYKYTTPALAGQLDLDTIGSTYDTMLAVWTGTRGNLTLIGCNDDIGFVNELWDQDSVLAVPLQSGTTYYIEVSKYNGHIDINGASATELQDKPDLALGLGDVASLEEIKSAIDKGETVLSASQDTRGGDVGAQLWGGQMQLHVAYHPVPTTPTPVSPLEGATLTRTNNTLLDWATTNGSTCTVHVWGGSIDISPSGSCADLALGEQRGGAYSWQVTSTNAYGSSMGPVWHFNVRPYTPTSLLASVASSTQVNLAWTLSSDEPADVDSYDVYKNGALLTNIPKGTANYSATGLTCNTSYSFYLRAKRQGVQSDNSNTVTITPPCPPAAFNKSSPANAAVSQPIGLTLSWAASTGASGYEYCIDTTSGSTCDTSWVGTGTAISVAVSNLSPSTTHYWQVRAVNSVDAAYANTSAWWSFTTGALPGSFTKISPSNNSTGQPVSLTLSWAGSAGATSYKYCFDTTNDNACGNWVSAASATSTIISGLNYDTTYYWHVQALNAIGTTNSDGNTWRSFTTGHLPGGFNKSTPANLATSISINPTLSWFASTSAVSYEYCISTTSAGCTTWVDVGNQAFVNLSNLAIDTTYYWNVRAVNTTGITTATDVLRSFTTVGIPAMFVKSAPANSTTILLPPNVTLTWEASAGVVDYEYCLDTTNDSACQSNSWINANANTNADLTGTLLANTTYYWQVRAINTYGIRYANGGTWWAFKTMAVPVAPVLALPITAYTTNDTTPSFSWNSVPAGNTYMIQIDNDSTFTSPVQIYTTASGAPLTYEATPLADGTYYWRVKAINVSNESGVWSASRTFIIDTLPTSAPLLSTPTDNGFTALPKPTLGVLAVTGATRYQFQVSAEAGFGSLVVDANNITTTSYTLATALPYGRYYWRALAVDAAGNLSTWSVVRSFTVTFMSAPIDGGFAATDIPTFTWAAVTGALEYHLQVDETDSFAIPELERYQSSGTTYVSLSPLDYGIHYWRMQVRTAGGWSGWTPAWRLTLTPPLATPPSLVNPANAAFIADSTPDLTWNTVLADDRYELQIDNLNTFASPEQIFTSGVGALAYTATTLPDGVWYWRVRTINYLNIPSAWSASRSFTVDTTGPVAPVLSAPANAGSVIGTPAFSWAAAAMAAKYQFEYDNDADFSSPTYTSADLTTTSHTPPAIALGTYSWHVRGKDAAGNWGTWSAVRTVTILPLVPVAPTLATPAASAVISDSTPDFNWNSVVSGNTYELEISNASTFATKQQTFAGGVGVLNYTATTIPDGVWYWHVRALNVNGVAGTWSAYRSFTVDTTGPVAPNLSSPANAASVIGTPAFSWAAAATAAKYQFEYDNDADFSSPIYTSADLTTTSHTPPTMALGTYSWHVRGKDAAGNWGAWSAVRTVTILPAVPVAPVLVSLTASAVTSDSTPDFTWNSVISGNTYELEISNASTFATKQQTFAGGVGILNYAATTIPDGVWYWHVRALNVNGVAGTWSANRSFTVDTTGPVAPVLSAPANAGSVIGTPAFSWAAAATAAKYQFEYDNDADFSSPTYTSADLTTTSHTPPAIALGTYSWHVRGKDAAGNWGTWSAVRTVTILPLVPVAPTLATPAASAVISDSTPDFNWNSVVSGNTYELEISNASTFATKQQTFAGGVGVLNYTATTIPDGVWYWHVRALNVNGVAGTWSAYRSFTVDTTGPVAPNLSSPANAASVIGTPAFSWAAATTATKYQFEYDNDADFSSPIYTSADLTTTSHTPPTMALGTYSWHVRGKDAAGNWGAWSTARTVTILPLVPVAPTLATPAASAVTNDSTPDFSWNSVVSGNTYELEISNASTFATKQQTFAGGVGILNYAATTIPDGVWYWHVRALNVNGVAGTWSANRSFTVDTTGPVAPVLSAPANAGSVIGTPAFSWAAAATAAKYQFEYDNDADFSSPTYTSADLTTTSHTPPAMALGTYSWHVRGKDAAGNWGTWSTTRIVSIIPLMPATPTLTSPANGSISQNPAPALNWTAMPNASSYQVQMDNNSTFSSPEFDGNSATNTITPISLADGIYYWRVRQTNILGGTSLWSAAWRVTISQPIPAAPNGNSLRSLELPTSDTGLPTFNWSSVEYGMTYQLQVADNETFTDPIFDDTAETTDRTLTEALTIGEYFWRVRAINEYGTAGPWSETWTITVDIPPAAPTLLLPSESTISLNGEASFSWQDSENAEKYQIQVDNAEDFSSPEFDDTAIQTTRELPEPLTDGTYFWRVRGLNIYDTVGEWSEVRLFTVSIPPAAPTLLTPEVDSTDETGLPTFEWEAVFNGVTYQIQVDNNADFNSPEFDDTAETTTHELATPLENGTYYWRVRAIKADDTFGAWSLVWSFTVNVP